MGLLLFQAICSGITAVCLVILGTYLVGSAIGRVAVIHIWYSELAVILLLLTITVAVTAPSSPTFSRVAVLGGLSGPTVLTTLR